HAKQHGCAAAGVRRADRRGAGGVWICQGRDRRIAPAQGSVIYPLVIACDKRKAFAQGSERRSNPWRHKRISGLLRFARNDAVRATPYFNAAVASACSTQLFTWARSVSAAVAASRF